MDSVKWKKVQCTYAEALSLDYSFQHQNVEVTIVQTHQVAIRRELSRREESTMSPCHRYRIIAASWPWQCLPAISHAATSTLSRAGELSCRADSKQAAAAKCLWWRQGTTQVRKDLQVSATIFRVAENNTHVVSASQCVCGFDRNRRMRESKHSEGFGNAVG